MNTIRIPQRTKVKISVVGIWHVLRRPRYLGLALVGSVLFLEFIFWVNNLALLLYILQVPTLSPIAKLHFIGATYTSIWQSTTSPLAVSLLLLSMLQGVAIACLIFIIRRQHQNMMLAKTVGGSAVASVLAFLGLGCAACGTSLITPLLSLLFSSTSTAMADNVGFLASVLGLVVSLYALYSLGLKTRAV